MSFSKIKRSDLKFGDEIGRGGSSTVYRATWKRSLFKSQNVAAKKLLNYNPNELKIAAKLDHVNIVKLIGVVDENPDVYLILELCEGGSLRSYLDKRQGQRLPDEQFYDWAKQAARAIEYLKKMGVVHKDVKAENYVIANNDILKLTDFGLAKEIDVTKSNATGSGTYGYMAPELMKDFILSPMYDIFSFGVVIWELQTTEKPFKGEDQHAIIWMVCKHNEHPPIPAECPQLIADLIRQCWLLDWKKRPQIGQVLALIIEAQASAVRALRQRQLLNGPWELERKIGKDGPGKLLFPNGVAVNPANGDIVTANSYDSSVQLFSAEGHHKLRVDITQDTKLLTPAALPSVTASRDGGFYFLTCSQYVRCYDVNGLYRIKWVAISPQGKPLDTENEALSGLALDANDQLLVGEVNTKNISTHRYDGSHVASFKVGIAPFTLTVTSQGTIVICDRRRSNSVHIVDNVGHLLHVIKPPAEIQEWIPRGIACYGDVICICNQDSIRCFSLSGEYLGSIPIEMTPRLKCLTFTADGKKLLITYWLSNTGLAVYRLQV